ncbi:MAG: TonB-dependent receptor domain-containing protein [Steroidobacteraceae bacterium]
MSIKSSESVSYSVRAAVALILGAAAVMASVGPALAADDSTASKNALVDEQTTGGGAAATATAPVNLQEVTVTGTRIRRRDLQSMSPLVTVDSSQIESRAGLNLESYLNQMPQYNPAQTPTTENEDVQPSATNTVGISTISLRGLGPNRSLVLIDGHRTTPVNELMDTDIDSIPAAMIDRVEIVSGGASAVYGADALGGVTNFILKKNFQGAQIDAQDSEAQMDDGNQADVSAIMGTNFADGKGNVTMGLEWYNRAAAYEKNRDFYTNAWTDPAAGGNAFGAAFLNGTNALFYGFATPSQQALNTLFPNRTSPVMPGGPNAGAPYVCGFSGCAFGSVGFNNDGTGSLFVNGFGVAQGSGYTGPLDGTNGFGPDNGYDSGYSNSTLNGGQPPPLDTITKWSNPVALLSLPQTRYSFFANGHYDFANDVQFYTTARFSSNKTSTLLDVPETATFGWEASVPFNPATDSPINPAMVTSTTSAANLQQIYQAFQANPASNAYSNPGYQASGTAGAQHPVPWQLAMVLLSRSVFGGPPGSSAFFPQAEQGGIVTCNNSYSVTHNGAPAPTCGGPGATTSWVLNYTPGIAQSPQRATVDSTDSWQIETGFKFPLHVADWTGELYYSRGQSLDLDNGYGDESLERWRAVIAAPDYGNGDLFQGNAQGASTNFGTSVPQTCSGGYYGAIFAGATPSSDCLNAVNQVLPAQTDVQMDIVEANFGGSLFKLPAGEVSSSVGFQYRRVAGQYLAAGLQSTNSFLDQSIGLYPQGSNDNQIIARDGYAELFIPILNDKFVKSVNLDVGGRYSSYDVAPHALTFKVNMDAAITDWFRLRGGFNRATRAPNLGELYLPLQEYFAGGPIFGDPCSLRSRAPFGAGGAAPDVSASGAGPTSLASGQTAAGAQSTYLICQAVMGANASAYYYGANGNQSGDAGGGGFAWLNQEGNPNLTSETADTWTAGFVFNNLGQSPWISGLSGSVDWWQIHITNAIELYSADYAYFQCYGAVSVTNAAQAAAQAASPACQAMPRNQATGGPATLNESYSNLATIGEAGVDFAVNWIAQLSDLGLHVPGGITFNSQDSLLQYYRTKASPASYDVNTDWKDSFGPTLAGTNGGAFGYRLTAAFGYVLPSFSVNLQWLFYPSANSAGYASTQAIIKNNEAVAKSGQGVILNYTPTSSIAAPAWYQFNLTGSWTVNSWLQIRGGIDNLLDKDPAITGASAGWTSAAQVAAACNGGAPGCVAPLSYSAPSDGLGVTSAGFYDVYGRTFFVGFKASF